MLAFSEKEKVTIPMIEYNLLKEVYDQFEKQAMLFRIAEAERKLTSKKVKTMKVDEFIGKI